MSKEEMINRLLNCVIPSRYATYPKKWYEKLTEAQLYRMCQEIVVDGPTEDDYVNLEDPLEEPMELSDTEIEELILKSEYPTFPYRFNPENGDYEIYTESHQWERVYD